MNELQSRLLRNTEELPTNGLAQLVDFSEFLKQKYKRREKFREMKEHIPGDPSPGIKNKDTRGDRDGKLAKLEPHDTIVGEPESIVSIDWSEFWKEEDNI